jgi:hypothetical protein
MLTTKDFLNALHALRTTGEQQPIGTFLLSVRKRGIGTVQMIRYLDWPSTTRVVDCPRIGGYSNWPTSGHELRKIAETLASDDDNEVARRHRLFGNVRPHAYP